MLVEVAQVLRAQSFKLNLYQPSMAALEVGCPGVGRLADLRRQAVRLDLRPVECDSSHFREAVTGTSEEVAENILTGRVEIPCVHEHGRPIVAGDQLGNLSRRPEKRSHAAERSGRRSR